MHASFTVTGVVVVLAVLGLSSVFGVLWRRRQGRLVRDGDTLAPHLLAALGVPAGSVTLLQFSSQSCAPCRTTSRLLAEIATDEPAVSHVEVSVEKHLDVVRELDIRRTPTMLIVDSSGRIARRASGLPTGVDVRTALLEVS